MTDKIDLEPKIIERLVEKIIVKEVIKEISMEAPTITVERSSIGTSPLPEPHLSLQVHLPLNMEPKKRSVPSLNASTIESIVLSNHSPPQFPSLSVSLNTVDIRRQSSHPILHNEGKNTEEAVTKLQSRLL